MIRIFVGYDSQEIIAFHTLCHSILMRSSVPVSITPLARDTLKPVYQRDKGELSSTEFSYSRFLVPYLSDYQGVSLFMDCDMIVTRDIKELVDMFDDQYAVQVVKHDYTPKTSTKFLNQTQSKYEKKNWSSVMLFNNRKCKALTPEVVNNESGLYLHQFKWLQNVSLIGELPLEWNFLVDEYDRPEELPALIHFTLGGPYFNDYSDCDFSEVWWKEYRAMQVPLGSQRNSPEFKDESVRQVIDRGFSVSEVSGRLSASSHSSYEWSKAVQADKTEQQVAEPVEAESEILGLRAQLRRTKEDATS